ncbi:MAG: UDP-N-acetylmuramate--L-alanine ligase [Chloroflexi bacterium]|nr:UDP-N-acetylmuramate--L-alanine ligase [Chloroflexota bacterium]
MRIHFVGIGGIGMSALAHWFLDSGSQVSGSDLQSGSQVLRDLAQRGAVLYTGHDPAQVAGADMVVVTSAAQAGNPEIVAARERHLPVLKASQMLGQMMRGSIGDSTRPSLSGIGVAGTHGKTTTTGLISTILVAAGVDPHYIIGAEVPDLGFHGHRGAGPWFVAEADEFDRRFLDLPLRLAVVTNIEPDHLDTYGDFAGLLSAFRQFLRQVPAEGFIVACADSPTVRQLIADLGVSSPDGPQAYPRPGPQVVSYGLQAGAEWTAQHIEVNNAGGMDFTAVQKRAANAQELGRMRLLIPGAHNVCNALAAIATARLLNVPPADIARGLAQYHGAARRFQVLGQRDSIIIVDDYAHHPSEIRATLAAARLRYPQAALRVCFQPHTYTRTRLLFQDFLTCFADADQLVILPIYAAREQDTLGMDARDLAAQIDHPDCSFAPDFATAAGRLWHHAQAGDVILTLGAGDVWQVGALLKN